MYQVIIIEDDPMVAAIDKQYVEADSQFRVVRTFKSGGEALAHLPKLKADLIILDYYTPGMNGTEFVDQLHTLGESPFIIAVTSANDTHIVQGLLARGVLDYLVKPFQFPRFRQALDRFLQARRLLEQGPGSMDQSAIDQLVHHREALPPGTPLDKGVNVSTLSRIRRFFDENPSVPCGASGGSLYQRTDRRTCGPVPYHGTPLCQLHGGSGGDHQLYRLPDRRPPLHPLPEAAQLNIIPIPPGRHRRTDACFFLPAQLSFRTA